MPGEWPANGTMVRTTIAAVADLIIRIFFKVASYKRHCKLKVTLYSPVSELTALPESEKMAVFYAARTYYEDWFFSAARLIMKSR